MSLSKKHILISGLGSVGCRHSRNFSKLGNIISGIDPNPERRKDSENNGIISQSYRSLLDVFSNDESKIDGVIICSPTSLHPEQIKQCLNHGLPVLTEKPLGCNLSDVDNLCKNFNHMLPYLLVGYTWRYWPALKLLRELLTKEKVGKTLFARFFISAHLADWHPWENYKDFFMSSKDLGGGALLDESHWIDQMLWFFGNPNKICGFVGNSSDLDISSDDSVDFIAIYEDDLKVSVHLDIFGRPHEKTIQVIGSEGSILWNENDNEVKVIDHDGKHEIFKFNEERNFMFEEEAKEFIDILHGNPVKTCNWEDGLRVMKIIEAVRSSQESSACVSL